MPFFPIQRLAHAYFPRTVELRLPHGTVTMADAPFEIPRRIDRQSPEHYQLACALRNMTKTSAPVGTEVWAEIVKAPSDEANR
jgi:hypothetical protein